MGGPFDKPPLSAPQFEAELISRGFRWVEDRKLWVGPFGITVTGVANKSNYHATAGLDTPDGIGTSGIMGGMVGPGVSGLRKSLLADADEQLRAKRGQPHPKPYRVPPPPGQ